MRSVEPIIRKERGRAPVSVASPAVVLSQYHVCIASIASAQVWPDRACVVEQAILMARNKVPHVETILTVVGTNNDHVVWAKDAVRSAIVHFKAVADGKVVVMCMVKRRPVICVERLTLCNNKIER